MIHPSYKELMEVVNKDVKEGEEPVITSRYSIVLATSKRARQLTCGAVPKVKSDNSKLLSVAVQELYEGAVHIVSEAAGEEEEPAEPVEAAAETEPAAEEVL